MITSIMQPTFLPSPIYLSLIYQADNFVFLDNVQFSKQSWQQRNLIITKNGPLWITLPVLRKKNKIINKIEIDNKNKSIKKIVDSIKFAYSKKKYFSQYFPELEKIILKDNKLLSNLNIKIIKWLCKSFNIRSNFFYAADLVDKIGEKDDKVERLIKMCKFLKTKIYLSPVGAKNYLFQFEEKFKKNDIKIEYNNFDLKPFEMSNSNPSAIDLLFCEGEMGLKKILKSING
tara:strand:- start:46 stop:738 length:693 start_codon:yes stop_codon:yes gene_type:complete